jgi:eukaryotic-like serine/threonine-protein kinase
MIGQTISHYTILEKLGEGGMGVVYKAQDTKLDRFVALKFLPIRASVSEETKSRFLQEAKSAAALNHAHICTIYGIEEEGSQQFIVMEYVEGGTLRDKLPISNVKDALPIAIQIGEALQEAHAKGVVHRDIKSDNIMLTSKGQAKVMDFGLAKLKGSLKLTRTSGTVGTLAYMAPEQIQGGEVDARSDIFSFGVLLFEMLAGHLPFRGEHEAAMMYSILNEEPEPVQKSRPDLPAGLTISSAGRWKKIPMTATNRPPTW